MGAFFTWLLLYDWHENDPSHRLHGFTHPKRALINATADWNLSDRTQNIILRHMFPLTPVPPACREAWLVCLADKVCALAETFHMTEQFFASIKYPYDIKNPDRGKTRLGFFILTKRLLSDKSNTNRIWTCMNWNCRANLKTRAFCLCYYASKLWQNLLLKCNSFFTVITKANT